MFRTVGKRGCVRLFSKFLRKFLLFFVVIIVCMEFVLILGYAFGVTLGLLTISEHPLARSLILFGFKVLALGFFAYEYHGHLAERDKIYPYSGLNLTLT